MPVSPFSCSSSVVFVRVALASFFAGIVVSAVILLVARAPTPLALSFLLPPTSPRPVAFVLIIIAAAVLMVRPTGLFGTRS